MTDWLILAETKIRSKCEISLAFCKDRTDKFVRSFLVGVGCLSLGFLAWALFEL